jgi:hypothetical protein
MVPFIALFAMNRSDIVDRGSPVKRQYDRASEMSYDIDAKEMAIKGLQSQLETGTVNTRAEIDTTADEPADR